MGILGILFAYSLYFLTLLLSLISAPVPRLFRLSKADSNILKILQTFQYPAPPPPPKKKKKKKKKNVLKIIIIKTKTKRKGL